MRRQAKATVVTGAKSSHTNQKKTIDIFVSGGEFSSPYYTFSDKKGRTIQSFKVNPAKRYRFRRVDDASTHPFYISDQGFNQPSSNRIKLQGDGSHNSGIVNAESFTLSIKKRHRRSFSQSGQLFFYCTSHASMMDELMIRRKNKNKAQLRPIPPNKPIETGMEAEMIDTTNIENRNASLGWNSAEPWKEQTSLWTTPYSSEPKDSTL